MVHSRKLIFDPWKQKKKKSVEGSPNGSLDICVKYECDVSLLWIPVTIPASWEVLRSLLKRGHWGKKKKWLIEIGGVDVASGYINVLELDGP